MKQQEQTEIRHHIAEVKLSASEKQKSRKRSVPWVLRTEYQGRLAGLISMRDLTEQRKAENELQESRRNLQAVFNGVQDGIALFDPIGRVEAVNKRVLEVGGYAEGEIIGKTFDQLQMISGETPAKIPPVFEAVLSGESAALEVDLATKSGQGLTLDVRITPLKKENKVVGSIVVMRDITTRKRAEMLLQASEQRNRLLVENASEGIIVVQDGLLAYAIFAGFKWLTYCEARVGGLAAPRLTRFLYLFCWPGMSLKEFARTTAARQQENSIPDWIGATAKTLIGAGFVWLAVPAVPADAWLLRGWVGMVGIIMMLHFVTFHLLALALQACGFNALGRAVYGWIAKHRHCIGGVCSIPGRAL